LITQRVFIAKTCVWVRWKGYLLSKIQKIKKKQQQQFFSNKNLVSMTQSGITQNAIFLKI
jgi:hypothetical protein